VTLQANHGYSTVRVITRAELVQQHSQQGPNLRSISAGVQLN
jgi:hypothetical protein